MFIVLTFLEFIFHVNVFMLLTDYLSPIINPTHKLPRLFLINEFFVIKMRILLQAIAIGESKAFKAFNTTVHKTPYPGCEQFPWGTDQYWECCARRYTNSLFHQAGTCKMGPATDPDAVVDPQLKVYGITGLRVVDASIMPVLPAGHPNAMVYMIAEKASDMIKQTWGFNN